MMATSEIQKAWIFHDLEAIKRNRDILMSNPVITPLGLTFNSLEKGIIWWCSHHCDTNYFEMVDVYMEMGFKPGNVKINRDLISLDAYDEFKKRGFKFEKKGLCN